MPDHPQPVTTRIFHKMIEDFNRTSAVDHACRIQLIAVEHHLVLSIQGLANKAGYQLIAQQAVNILATGKTTSLIIDLTLCEQLASSPLGMIGLLMMTVRQRGGEVHLVTSSSTILRSLKAIGIHSLCTVVDDIDKVLG